MIWTSSPIKRFAANRPPSTEGWTRSIRTRDGFFSGMRYGTGVDDDEDEDALFSILLFNLKCREKWNEVSFLKMSGFFLKTIVKNANWSWYLIRPGGIMAQKEASKASSTKANKAPSPMKAAKAASVKAAPKKPAAKKPTKSADQNSNVPSPVLTNEDIALEDYAPVSMTQEQREEMVRYAAYHLAEKDGFKAGREQDYWFQAQEQVDQLLNGIESKH
ncbi:MAG: DUF2934 domain-containing protein [Proteobacteria bacterium]|nr:MAG: DUF2934 domain-containing protein [Pseudomonadota bacterium]